ncbi:MAG TPA: ADOP family duplicated permease [Gemmatimonadales bacterium]|nr:ADOP family duplicated permease [Gemmatimonadales bacterium]
MQMVSELRERLRAIVFRGRMERELEEELRFHLEHETAARRLAGSAEPEREARLALGGVERVKEAVRDARGVRPLETLVADIRFALRSLRRNPGFTVTVVLILGVAVGAATAVALVAHRVLLAPLPYPAPERLVRVDQRYGSGGYGTLSLVEIEAVTAQARSLEAFGAVRYVGMSLSGPAGPERIDAGRATAGYFRALAVRAARGRLIEAGDNAPGAAPVVVLSHAEAERTFGSPERAVGQSVTLDGVSHTVVGVLRPENRGLAGPPTDAWAPLQLEPPTRRGPFGYRGIGRLAPGVSLARAEGELGEISARIFPIWKASYQDSTARLVPVPLRQALFGYARAPIGLFAGAVALVVLAAVANAATLLLVRAAAREHEMAVRAALGAGRGRLARLVATECLVLSGLAALVATAVAAAGVRLAPAVAPNLPRIAQVQMGWEAVALASVGCVIAGLVVALAPLSVIAASGSAAPARLTSAGGARTGAGPRTSTARAVLVVAEFALAFPLLVGAGLLFTSFLRLERRELGFDPSGVYALDISLAGAPNANDTTRIEFWRKLEARAAELPGIPAVGLAGSIPPDNYGDVNNFNLVDRPVPAGTTEPTSPWPAVTSGYFAALGIELLEGRPFAAGDSAGAPPVAIVSRTWAAKYYPRESAVGKQLVSAGCTTCPLMTIIGVVSDVHYRGLAGEADAVYVPLAQDPGSDRYLVARSRLGAAATFRALRSALAAVDPDVAPVGVTLVERVDASLGDPRRWTLVVGAFASVGVLLAAVGTFGLMAYLVRQRQRELGVRLALGASPASLMRLVVRQGMRYAVLGSAIGIALALLQARWLGPLLFGVDAVDPRALGVAALCLLAVAALACAIPGLAATRIRPIEALSTG